MLTGNGIYKFSPVYYKMTLFFVFPSIGDIISHDRITLETAKTTDFGYYCLRISASQHGRNILRKVTDKKFEQNVDL